MFENVFSGFTVCAMLSGSPGRVPTVQLSICLCMNFRIEK